MSLAEDYMSVLIHRPGLTFDPNTRPFSECLRICTAACSRIISSAMSLANFRFAPGVGASLSSLVFQCALMVVFNHCHTPFQGNAIKDDVVQAVSFLNKCADKAEYAHSPHLLAALSDAGALLQSLSRAMDGGSSSTAASRHGDVLIDSALCAGERDTGEQMQLETPASMFGMDIDGSGLGDFGQLDSLDWIFDFNPEIPRASQ